MRKLIIPLIVAFLAMGGAVLFMALSRYGRHRVEGTVDRPALDSKSLVLSESASTDTADRREEPGQEDNASDSNSISLPDGPALRGRVTDEEGKGLPGAKVYLLPRQISSGDDWGRARAVRERLLGKESRLASGAGAAIVAQASADASGFYGIPLATVPAGEYLVLARDAAHAPRKEKWVCRSESDELDFRLGPGETIAGIVIDPDGKPVPGAFVEAFPDEEETGSGGGFGRRRQGDSIADRDETDSEGKFVLRVAPGKYRLTAAAKGFSRGSVHGVDSGSTDVEITLGQGRSIAGRVTNESGGPISGASVLLFKAFGGADATLAFGAGRAGAAKLLRAVRPPDARAESDAAGRFEIQDLPVGDYVVMSRKPGSVPAEAKVHFTEDIDTASVDLSMAAGKVLSGTVTDVTGQPVEGAFVVVAEDRGPDDPRDRGRFGAGQGPTRGAPSETRGRRSADATGGTQSSQETLAAAAQARRASPLSLFRADEAAETTSDGKFVFDTLPKGTYSLSVQLEDFVPHRRNGIELDRPLDLKVVLESGIRIEGRVLSSVDGKPVPHARVRFEITADDRREVRADDEGHYAIGGLLAVRLGAVEVDARGFAVQVQEGVSIPESPQIQARNFTLDPASRLSGIVTDLHGAPVAKARVTVAAVVEEREDEAAPSGAQRRRQQMQARSALTDADGMFRVDEVNATLSLQVTIEHPDFKRFRSDVFSVAPGAQAEGLHYKLHAGGKVEVTVTDSSGAAVEDARVTLTLATEEQATEQTQDRADQSAEDRRRARASQLARQRQSRTRGITRQTSREGRAAFLGLEGGNYAIAIAKAGFQPFSSSAVVIEDQSVAYPIQLQPENVISGIVQDRAGSPVSGVAIQAVKDGDSDFPGAAPGAKTGADGAFRVGSLGDGPYTLRVRCDGFASRSVAQVEVNTQVPVVLERLGGISGVVLAAETAEPITSFQVRLREEGGGNGEFSSGGGRRSRGERKSFNDPSGAFSLSNIAPGAYLLQVTAPEHAGAEARVQVIDGAVTQGVQVLLVEGLSLSGAVVLKGTASPIAGAEIFLVPLPDTASDDAIPTTSAERADARTAAREKRIAARRERTAGGGATGEADALLAQITGIALEAAQRGGGSLAVTDEMGSFQLKEVPAGRYTLVVNHEAYVPARVDVAIGEDRVARAVRVDLEPGESLSGTVTFQDGSAAAGATVFARDSYGLGKRAQADVAGRYVVQGLLPGAFTLSASAALAGIVLRGDPAEIQIGKGANQYDYRLVPSP